MQQNQQAANQVPNPQQEGTNPLTPSRKTTASSFNGQALLQYSADLESHASAPEKPRHIVKLCALYKPILRRFRSYFRT